jgi:DNA-binding response OmpR family regulator
MSKQILVVDDTKELLRQIYEVLAMEGHSVTTAANGEIALKLLPDIKVDLIITDLMMPELDGFEFITQVRRNDSWRAVPIMVFSVMPSFENSTKVINLGANSFLKKPSSVDDFVEAVDKLIQNEKAY